MILLAIDTATTATVVALRDAGGTVLEARDDPPAGTRPRHAAAVLALAEDLLGRAGVDWSELTRIAVGVGPGAFTGLRIGVSTGRALAQAHGLALVGVSSLRSLALGARDTAAGRPVLAAIDARRGEAFAAAWSDGGEPVLAAAAYAPGALVEAVSRLDGRPLAVGDGALRFSGELGAAGIGVPAAGSALHRVSGEALCRLALDADPLPREAVLPDYRREPDAKPPRLP